MGLENASSLAKGSSSVLWSQRLTNYLGLQLLRSAPLWPVFACERPKARLIIDNTIERESRRERVRGPR